MCCVTCDMCLKVYPHNILLCPTKYDMNMKLKIYSLVKADHEELHCHITFKLVHGRRKYTYTYHSK